MEALCCNASHSKEEFEAATDSFRASVSRWAHWSDESGLTRTKAYEIKTPF